MWSLVVFAVSKCFKMTMSLKYSVVSIILTINNLVPKFLGLGSYPTAPFTLAGRKERNWLQNNKLNSPIEEDRFQMQERQWLQYWGISYVVFYLHHRGPRGPHHSNLTGPKRACSPVRVFVPFRHIIEWLLRLIFQPLPTLENSLQQGKSFMYMRKAYLKYLNLLSISL